MQYLLARLKESSTYQGIIFLLGAFGLSVNPQAIQEIGVGVGAAIGLVQTFFPDNKISTNTPSSL